VFDLAYAKSFRKLGITDPIAAPPKFYVEWIVIEITYHNNLLKQL
jgi:hypothetical protein